jgi:hypothetical protein
LGSNPSIVFNTAELELRKCHVETNITSDDESNNFLSYWAMWAFLLGSFGLSSTSIDEKVKI